MYSCNQVIDDKFPIIAEFNKTKNQYNRDTIDLEGFSLEGSELVVYHKNTDTLILDFFVYGETGKLNYTYFTNKNLDYKFVIKRNYTYGRPITEESIKIDSTVYFLENDSVSKLYDKNAKEIKDSIVKDTIILEIEHFYQDTSKYIRIKKQD